MKKRRYWFQIFLGDIVLRIKYKWTYLYHIYYRSKVGRNIMIFFSYFKRDMAFHNPNPLWRSSNQIKIVLPLWRSFNQIGRYLRFQEKFVFMREDKFLIHSRPFVYGYVVMCNVYSKSEAFCGVATRSKFPILSFSHLTKSWCIWSKIGISQYNY